jgi:hypothetical protein
MQRLLTSRFLDGACDGRSRVCSGCQCRRSRLSDAVTSHHRRLSGGGSTGIVVRLIGDWLGKWLGQQFVVENRPGAGSNCATEAAAPDGYTLMLNPVNARRCRLGGPAPCMSALRPCAGRAPPRTLRRVTKLATQIE